MMTAHKNNLKFIEPQSMNFEKKLSEAYLVFKEQYDKKTKENDGKAEKNYDDKDKDNNGENEQRKKSKKHHKEQDRLSIVENNFEDLLFTISQASNKIHH